MTVATDMFRQRRTENPRTVLAFFGTAIGLVLAACVSAVAALASTGTSTYLIPWILAFGALVSVLLVLAILKIVLTDPSKLMLGQVTGQEYARIQQLILGDSTHGERSLLDATAIPQVATPASPFEPSELELDAPRQEQDEEEDE